jgi:hypothetical protein
MSAARKQAVLPPLPAGERCECCNRPASPALYVWIGEGRESVGTDHSVLEPGVTQRWFTRCRSHSAGRRLALSPAPSASWRLVPGRTLSLVRGDARWASRSTADLKLV